MRQSFAFAVSGVLGGGTYEINCPLKCPFNTGPFQVLFRCLRLLNRGVRLKKVSFKVNKGNKFEDFAIVCLIEGVRSIPCPLNTGFTVYIIAKNYITKICRYSGCKGLNNRNVISLQLFNLILLWKENTVNT